MMSLRQHAATASAARSAIKNLQRLHSITKKDAISEVEDNTDYETMDQPSFLDALYYEGGKLTEAGQEFLTQMDTYREGMVALLGDSNPTLSAQINNDFSTADITIVRSKPNDYINYNYVGFPLVSSLTKMTQIQNDIKSVKMNYYHLFRKLKATC